MRGETDVLKGIGTEYKVKKVETVSGQPRADLSQSTPPSGLWWSSICKVSVKYHCITFCCRNSRMRVAMQVLP